MIQVVRPSRRLLQWRQTFINFHGIGRNTVQILHSDDQGLRPHDTQLTIRLKLKAKIFLDLLWVI